MRASAVPTLCAWSIIGRYGPAPLCPVEKGTEKSPDQKSDD